MTTILVTGANRGIGLELTKQYLQAGVNIIACCRAPEKAEALQTLHQQFPGHLNLLAFDANQTEASIAQLRSQLKDQPIDILINNAGMFDIHLKLDEASWLTIFKVNTIAPFLLAEALLENVQKSERKMIVNMSSQLGSIGDNQEGGNYLYRASKAALNSITKTQSIAYHPKHIIVIAMHPGWVKTDMGGANAPLTVEKSVDGIRKTIATLSLKDSGSFVSHSGRKLPW